METSLCLVNRLKCSSIRSYKHWSIYINTEFSIAIWSHKTCWSTQPVRTSSLLTLVWRVLLAYRSRRTLMKSSLYGIGALKSSLAKKHILSELISGQLGASSRKWCSESHSSWATPKLTKSSKFSRFSVHQMRTTGLMHLNLATSRGPSPSSQACLWVTIHPHLTSSRSTCFLAWSHWILTDAFRLWQPSNIPTSMTWTEPAWISANNSSELFFASFFTINY